MQWQLSEEQEAYRDSLGDWLGHVAQADTVRGWLDAEDLETFHARFAQDGWSGVGVPEELGGQGGGLLELVLTAEAFGGRAVPSAAWLASVLAAPALAGDPSTESSAAGETTVVLVTSTEVPGNPPPLQIDDRGRLSGRVPLVLAAGQASRFVVPVVAADGVQLRSIDASAGELSCSGHRLLDRSRSVADVVLAGVPSEPLVVDGQAFLEQYAARAAVLVAADALGAMHRMLDLAVDYSKQRHQFGVPIGSFQAVKHAAAEMLVDVEAGRSATYYAAASVDNAEALSPLHAAAVKAQVTAAAARAADTSLTLHGAIGYTWEHDLHFFYKRARLDEHLFGSPTAWNETIADRLDLVPA